MPDGTGEDYVSPSLATLKQLSWDIGYTRDKLTFGGVSKSFFWRRHTHMHQMVVGKVMVENSDFRSAFRAMAAAIAAGQDGSAPPPEDFGQSNWSHSQLLSMHDGLVIIANKIMTAKRTLTMRMAGMAGSNVELTIGDIFVSHVSYRSAIAVISGQISSGSG